MTPEFRQSLHDLETEKEKFVWGVRRIQSYGEMLETYFGGVYLLPKLRDIAGDIQQLVGRIDSLEKNAQDIYEEEAFASIEREVGIAKGMKVHQALGNEEVTILVEGIEVFKSGDGGYIPCVSGRRYKKDGRLGRIMGRIVLEREFRIIRNEK